MPSDVDTLQYRDHQYRWWQTEATWFEVGSNGQLTLKKSMGDGLWQFIECIPKEHWTSVRSTAEPSQATRRIP